MERRNERNYRSFDSDEESDSDDSFDSIAGPDFADFARSLKYDKSEFRSNHEYYHPYTSTVASRASNKLILFDEPLPADSHTLYGNSKFESARKDKTTLFLIDSKNRDKNSYPQPTSFTLKPPRVYRNVVSIQVTQIKLLSSFFYFRNAKSNTVLPVIERGREAIARYLGFPLTEAISIPEGTYNINDLLSQLQIQMNFTPLFYDFPNGFSDFVTAFTTTGDLFVNFNQPGDTYYDSLNSKYINNPTINQIISYYWGNRYAGLTEYSLDQVKCAYYYPVIYELIIDTENTTVYGLFNQNVPANLLGENEDVRSHILFNPSGLNDPVVLYLINNNISILDQYRTENTFRNYLVNRYQLAYDTNSLRVNIISLTLNTSLVNLLNLRSEISLMNALSKYGYTQASYSNISNTQATSKVIYNDMYNYIQSQLTTYFGIPFATYASQYFVNVNNQLYIQNGLDAAGVRTGYDLNYLSLGTIPIVSSSVAYTNSPGYWPNFNPSKTNGGLNGGGIDLSGINVSTSIVPYNIASQNFVYGLEIIDSSNYFIQPDKSSRSVNSVIKVKPAKYTVFKFRSPVRQTLQVETLPLPYYYRFAEYNKRGLYNGIIDPNNNNVPQKYFDISYAFVYNTSGNYKNSLMDNSNYSTIKLNSVFGDSFITGFSKSSTLPLNIKNNYLQFEFTAPYINLAQTNTLSVYNTALSFICVNSNSISTLFSDTVQGYLYHDRAAFMADLQMNRQENSNHYIQSVTATNSNSDITFNISTFTGHKYYAIVRSANLGFSDMLLKPIIYNPSLSYINIKTDYVNFDPLANPYTESNLINYPFVINYNTDFLQLPTASSLQGIDPSNQIFTNPIVVNSKPIGYDISDISNDLTDYQGYIPGRPGFVPGTTFRIDPLSQYTFQALSPFDSNITSYFNSNSQNKILQPITNQPYTFKGTSSSQIKIVHWYGGYSIPQQVGDQFTSSNAISSMMTSSLLNIVPGTSLPILQGYLTNSNGDIQFGQGINAIGFLPTDGLYDVSSFTFKSVLYPTNNISTTVEDPNMQIKYIGVFEGSYLTSKNIFISSALTVLKYNRSVVYNSLTQSNTPNFGLEYGTWYEYAYDPSFVVSSNVKISGYTQGPTELLSYDSMYYMVPFNSNGSNITYSRLSGSVLPYPLVQTISTSPSYFGNNVTPPIGVAPQVNYIIPSTISGANSLYGPQSTVSYTQSQYEQSQPITTTSIGFREYGYLVRNSNALYTFNTEFSNSAGSILTNNIGINTMFSEYEDNLYIINSLSNGTNISNAPLSFTGAAYASSLSSVITANGGTTDCMKYLINAPSTVQNYSYNILSNIYSSFIYQDTVDDNNISVKSFTIDTTISSTTVWLWGAGGGANSGIGGAGAYAKVNINTQKLLNLKTPSAPKGISTIYVVVGRGGDQSSPTTTSNAGQLQEYEELKYGGGGTSLYDDPDTGSIVFQTRGGGFSGLFTHSNLLDPNTIPLIIVGGGGGGGNSLSNLGGPGGFGQPINIIPDILYNFSSATFNGIYSPTAYFNTVVDTDFNPLANSNSPVTNLIDNNLLSSWDPTGNPFMNLGNYNPTVNTYRIALNLGSNIKDLTKLRFYLEQQGNTLNIPTGYVIYNSSNKSQVLYSNTNVQIGDLQLINNGSGYQYVYDLMPISAMQVTTNNTNAFIAVGVASDYPENILQYSLDGSNWARATSVGGGFISNIGNSILYVASLGKWFAGGAGNGVNYGLTAGSNWTTRLTYPTVVSDYEFIASVSVSAIGKYQIACVGGFWISSDYGASWTLPVSIISGGISYTNNGPYEVPNIGVYRSAISSTGQYIAIILNNIINVSSNFGSTFTPITGIQTPNTVWFGLAMSYSGQYIVANSYDTSLMYISSDYGATWNTVSVFTGWLGLSISGSGQYILATSINNVYISSNYGQLFAPITVLGTAGAYGSAISGSGQYMLVCTQNNITYISSNYGGTWITVSYLENLNWRSAAISSSGRYMTVGIWQDGTIWKSYDYGVTWAQSTLSGISSWTSISMSGNGKYQLGITHINNTNSLSRGVYRSVAIDPIIKSSPILQSSDGVTWTPCLLTEYDGTSINSLLYGNGYILAGVSGSSVGSILVSTDGYNWSSAAITGLPIGSTNVTRNISYLNSIFWAVGQYTDGSCLKKSNDGISWITVTVSFVSSLNSIIYGFGRYIVSLSSSLPQYGNVRLLYSENNGLTWLPGIGILGNDLTAFSAKFLEFGNNTFIACGVTSDGSTNIKYSIDGKVWLNTNYQLTGDTDVRNQVKYLNGQFICVGYSQPGSGRAPNQKSIVLSLDGIVWRPILSGGFNSDRAISCQAFNVDYGAVSIVPNLSSIYIEIQKITPYEPIIYEIQGLSGSFPIQPQGPNNGISSLIDNNRNTIFWPSEDQKNTTISYPVILNFSSGVSTINKLQFYAPYRLATSFFTGLTVLSNVSTNIIFQDLNINSNLFIRDIEYSYYETHLVPPMSNVSTLFINFNKTTLSSIQLLEARALYDNNVNITPHFPINVTDLDNRGGAITNIIDGNISSIWAPNNFKRNDTIRLNFTFTNVMTNVNRVQIYNSGSNDTTHVIDGVYIYSDSNKTNILYSNDNPVYNTYLNYNRFDLTIQPLINTNTIYIELVKNSATVPWINEIKFYSLNDATNMFYGYSGGTISSIVRGPVSLYPYDGGGGTDTDGGGLGGIATLSVGSDLDTRYTTARQSFFASNNPLLYPIAASNLINSIYTIPDIINNLYSNIYSDFPSYSPIPKIPGVSIPGYPFIVDTNIRNKDILLSNLNVTYTQTNNQYYLTLINSINALDFIGLSTTVNTININGNILFNNALSEYNNIIAFSNNNYNTVGGINYLLNYTDMLTLSNDLFNIYGLPIIPTNIIPSLSTLTPNLNIYNVNATSINNTLQTIPASNLYGINFITYPILNNTSIYNTRSLYLTRDMSNIITTMNTALAPLSNPPNSYTGGLIGSYLTGGSPGVVTIYPRYGITANLGGGGGGGGYYGGGGASRGGGGGGGAGYIYDPSILTLVDYAIAAPSLNGQPTNYITPGYSEQDLLINTEFVPFSDRLRYYGQGAYGKQSGSHGLVVFSYLKNIVVTAPNNERAFPRFVDGSKLALFKAPIQYNTDNLNINFSNYSDSIEATKYAGYNWVWYRSYLSLVGLSLQATMTASATVPTQPISQFPSLPEVVYETLAYQFNSVSTFYGGIKTNSNIVLIANSIGLALNLFQTYFTQISYRSPNYIEMTEIYGILDYLQNSNNLARPHLDPLNPQLDRIFGGVPRFGYWANPFLINASYVGFDVAPSQYPTSALSNLVGASGPVTAMYGLVLEQSLSSGIYTIKDIMAYKPTVADGLTSFNWLIATQFPESYVVRSTIGTSSSSNISVQPYTMKSAIQGQLPLFNYKVYTTPYTFNTNITINSPIHMINDFQAAQSFLYTFQNTYADNVSSITVTTKNTTSTTIHVNQTAVTARSNLPGNILGTVVSEYQSNSVLNIISKFGFNNTTTTNYTPILEYTPGNNNFYNIYANNSGITQSILGKSISDYNGNLFAADNLGGSNLYENVCTSKMYYDDFNKISVNYASHKFILSQYKNGNSNPFYDTLDSKYTNIWHLQGTQNISTIYGARLTSPIDYNFTTNFINQVFYPTHKIILTKKGTSGDPIINAVELINYPSYQRTEMFFYRNFSSMSNDIYGKFALENTSNFAYNDMTSGYFFNSYINNINLTKSVNYNNADADSFNYLAIRAYSPSETFQSLVRFYLPGRYDFGYISLKDLSNEIVTVQTNSNVNPDYFNTLSLFTSSFIFTNKIFGASGLSGFNGSNVSSLGFGDFLNQYINVYNNLTATGAIVSSVNGLVTAGVSNLITGDLKNILPSYIASRTRINDPLEFMLPLSTIVVDSNRNIDEYGLGYNLGFAQKDTVFNTFQRAGSFFKILDDYVYLKMNEEFNMNRLDITSKENFAVTLDPTAQANMYNCKLLLNNFGTYATTFVQNPVTFNPMIGKLDKLSFSWYDVTGQIIDNTECEWSGAIQIVERLDVATDDSTATRPSVK